MESNTRTRTDYLYGQAEIKDCTAAGREAAAEAWAEGACVIRAVAVDALRRIDSALCEPIAATGDSPIRAEMAAISDVSERATAKAERAAADMEAQAAAARREAADLRLEAVDLRCGAHTKNVAA